MSKINLNLNNFKGKRLLLAHSGGVDSSVLAHIFLKKQINFSVAHCNFKLRSDESDGDLEFVKDWCNNNNIKFFSKVFYVKEYKIINKKSIQESARDLRYNWFNDLIKEFNFDILVTAHHLNDQLETFLINCIRGTGILGLLGIPQTEKIARPLLEISKKEILIYAKKNKIRWREDNSNSKNEYLRNRIRNQVISPLEQIKPNTIENFQTTLFNLSNTEEFLNIQFNRIKEQIFKYDAKTIHINIELLKKQKPLNFCLFHLFSPFGFDDKEVEKLMYSNSGKVITSSSHRLIRNRDEFLLAPLTNKKKYSITIDIYKNNNQLPFDLQMKTKNFTSKDNWMSNEAFLDKDLLKNPLHIRKYKKGDYFYPQGMVGKKLLSKFFKDEKYSLLEKEQQWLLCSEDEIVWVVGRRCDRRFTANSNTKNKILMRLRG
jgi:tRNA(Ile)-lysidine synthase